MSGAGDYAAGYAAGLRRAGQVVFYALIQSHKDDDIEITLRDLRNALEAEAATPAPTPRVGGQDTPTVRPASVSIAQAPRRPDAWQVNCIDCKGVGIYEYTLFEGVGSFDRAHAYADWRYGSAAAQVPADAPAHPAEHPGAPEAASEAPGAVHGQLVEFTIRWIRPDDRYTGACVPKSAVQQQALRNSAGEVEWRDVPVVVE